MSLRVGKYDYKTKTQPVTPGYDNILIHTTGQLSPYTMRDSEGVIMENYWQFSKIWPQVYKISQPISQFHKGIRWQHPAEIHLVDGQLTDDYWNWREKGFAHTKWVRYPNGYKYHSEAYGSVIGDKDSYEIVGYIEARKRIYYPKYREIATSTSAYKKLKARLARGESLQIVEVDGPTYADSYPYNLVVDGSIAVEEDILKALINNPTQAFGHRYSLTACLLDLDLTNC